MRKKYWFRYHIPSYAWSIDEEPETFTFNTYKQLISHLVKDSHKERKEYLKQCHFGYDNWNINDSYTLLTVDKDKTWWVQGYTNCPLPKFTKHYLKLVNPRWKP